MKTEEIKYKTKPEDASYPTSMQQFGLTKREYFAAMAMQGILSKEAWAERIVSEQESPDALRVQLADASVAMADALITSLNK
jgi:hypothetical protein